MDNPAYVVEKGEKGQEMSDYSYPPEYNGGREDSKGKHYGPERGVAIQHLVCGFYGLIIFVMGFTFIMADALGNDYAHQQEYVMLLHTVMFIVGILFCLYLQYLAIKEKGIPPGSSNSVDISGTGGTFVIWHPEGISIFLRLGAILFGATGIAMHLIRFTNECRGSVFMLRHATGFVFIIVQTFVLVWNHKMCIQVKTYLARWGFAHLMAVNLTQWAYIVIFEAYENILHDMIAHGDDHGDDHGDGYGDSGKGYGNSTSDHGDEHHLRKRAAGLGSIFDKWAGCGFAESLQFKIAPYLFPCIIEYVLIMAAIGYKFYFNVGNKPEPAGHQHYKGQWDLKAVFSYGVAGLLGLTCIVTAIVACVFIFEMPKRDNLYLASDMFFIGEISLLCLAVPTTILAAIRLRDLGWRQLDDMLDGRLLLFTYVGTIVIDSFSLISGVRWYTKDPVAVPWELGRDILNVTQCLLQVGLILDGLSRCANNKKQAEKKPGQAVLLLLLMFNVGMWLLMVFEPKMTSAYPEIPKNYYGQQGWNIIKSICLPLIIFFRFHSIVCLADVMTEAYLIHPHHD